METKEVWKSLPHLLLKNTYEVSNKGRVRNKFSGHIRKPSKQGEYLGHTFHINDKHYSFKVHSLVTKLFVPNQNPKIFIQINHIDGIKIHNNHQNLEWVTRSKNSQHAIDTGLTKINRISLKQYDLNNNFIKDYESQTAAANETGIDRRLISAACNGSLKIYTFVCIRIQMHIFFRTVVLKQQEDSNGNLPTKIILINAKIV
jgi:hypothetical protein